METLSCAGLPRLAQAEFLCGATLSLADIVVWSAAVVNGAKLEKNVKVSCAC